MTSHIAVLPTDVLDAISVQLQDQTRFLRLPHPRTGVACLFLPYLQEFEGGKRDSILEVQAVTPPNARSWFLNNEQVVEDGKLLMMTPIDPVFLLIPILQAACPEGEKTATFRQADDIFEQAITNLAAKETSKKDPSEDFSSKDLLKFASMDFIPRAMKQLCEVKEITAEITVYRFSVPHLVEYLRNKASRLVGSAVFEHSRTVVRGLAKDGLMEDGKESLLLSGRNKAACDMISHHLPPDIKAALLKTYDFSDLGSYLQSLQDDLTALKVTDSNKLKKKNTQVATEDESKKRKTSKDTHGVAKLKKVNTEGMSKISSFFQKPK